MLLNEMLLEDAEWWLADDEGQWIATEAKRVCNNLYREWAYDWPYLGEQGISWLALLIREAIK